MNGIKNFLEFLNNNWTLIITIIGLGIGLYTKIKNYIKLSKQEKIDIALEQIRKIMLDLVVESEKEYGSKTGKLKRSKVLKEIYNQYPVLKDIVKQEDIEKIIDDIIDENLDKMRNMIENNEEFKNLIYGVIEKEEN